MESSRSRPIRISAEEWIIMRDEPTQPKALVRRVSVTERESGQRVAKLRVVTWAIDPAERKLVGYFDTMTEVDRAVPWAPPPRADPYSGAPNGRR
jgi:hypothetical protein